MAAHGHFHWMELNTREREKAKAFYGAALGWTFEDVPMGGGAPYVVCKAGGDMVAGFFTMEGEGFDGVPEHWFVHIAVDDVDRRVDMAKAAGGTVVREPWDIEGVGRVAIVKDSSGAVSGWITPSA
ncbi:VOC family protein [Pararhizobium haloflavum]|uniref:VOC family protein n=1 Tax=Pararhizobium haloflavum TaxID=2037914 RepID=UPI000C1A098E|nr:VOC family protein [Pararhizobium haloflavum]